MSHYIMTTLIVLIVVSCGLWSAGVALVVVYENSNECPGEIRDLITPVAGTNASVSYHGCVNTTSGTPIVLNTQWSRNYDAGLVMLCVGLGVFVVLTVLAVFCCLQYRSFKQAELELQLGNTHSIAVSV